MELQPGAFLGLRKVRMYELALKIANKKCFYP